MVNLAPIALLLNDMLYALAAVAGGLAGYAIGRPLKRRIIAKWARR